MVKEAIEAVRKGTGPRTPEQKTKTQTSEANAKDFVRSASPLSSGQNVGTRQIPERDLQERIREVLRRKATTVSPDSSAMPSVENAVEEEYAGLSEPGFLVSEPMGESDRVATLARYKLVLASVWTDGAASEEETQTLEQLRELLSITRQEHEHLQKDVQVDTYTRTFKKAWNAGKISKKDVAALAELRERFHISMEEHVAIESRILRENKPEKDRPTLLLIDDDEKLLSIVADILNDAGFTTTPFTTSDEALSYLKKSSPNLILCDVNLRTSSMGGFAFYEKVRELSRLRDTPFIFLSGLTDETLVKAGKELGVDDYLSKPVSEEILLATIRGKLRRYNELRESTN